MLLTVILLIVIGYFIARGVFLPAVERIEAVEPAKTGFLGGLGLPVLLSWIVGGVIAAGAAWFVGKVSLGLRSDYLDLHPPQAEADCCCCLEQARVVTA